MKIEIFSSKALKSSFYAPLVNHLTVLLCSCGRHRFSRFFRTLIFQNFEIQHSVFSIKTDRAWYTDAIRVRCTGPKMVSTQYLESEKMHLSVIFRAPPLFSSSRKILSKVYRSRENVSPILVVSEHTAINLFAQNNALNARSLFTRKKTRNS